MCTRQVPYPGLQSLLESDTRLHVTGSHPATSQSFFVTMNASAVRAEDLPSQNGSISQGELSP